jgi:hypothetical protein
MPFHPEQEWFNRIDRRGGSLRLSATPGIRFPMDAKL